MPVYLVKYQSVFTNIAVVNAESQEAAEEMFSEADFFQKHMGEVILETTVAEEGYENRIREEGYF